MTKQPFRLLFAALLLGWAFDFLFWKKPVGINFAVFTTACLLVCFLVLLTYGLRPALKSLWLVLPFAFFVIMTVIRQEPLTLFLAYALTLLVMGVFAVTYLGGRWMEYSLFDYFNKFFQLLGSMLIQPQGFYRRARKERAESGETIKGLPVKPVLRGLALAVPILGAFSYLLASADMVYNKKVYEFFQFLSIDQLGENTLRLGLILVCGYVLSGVMLHAASKSRDAALLSEGKPVIKAVLGFIEAATVLGSVAALFFIFVVIQFQYFFGGKANIGIEGFTYSEYARRGFNELVIVAFLSLLLTLGLNMITRRESETQRRIYSGLSAAIAALVIVILVSAYQRLSLAIDWHGFSRLRVYPSVFLIWVGILFVVVVLLEIFHRERHFALAALLAVFGFVVSLSVLNVDASIARHNIYRVLQGKYLNVSYLSSLSSDAVPVLADALLDTSLPVQVRQDVGAALLCYTHPDRLSIYADSDWRSMNFSRIQARAALDKVQPYLKGYQVNEDPTLTRVGTPRNEWFDCAGADLSIFNAP